MPLLLVAAALTAGAGVAAAQTVALATPTVLDGPSPNIDSLGGVSVARDGSGGLVYLKRVAGVPHVFVSRLHLGVFQSPEQLDASLASASSQPVIAAGNGGLLLIAFLNAGQLYVVDRTGSANAYTTPILLSPEASDPALSISTFGKAYLAFAAARAGAHDVRCAYYYAGRWALESAPLDANAADDAGTGSGRPAVAAAGDGVGIVAWGEAGHVYSRKVWGTAPSVVFEQADVPSFGGWNEVSADQPAVGAGGDSSYAAVAYHELLSSGGPQQSRVLIRRLRGSRYESVTGADGLGTPGSGGADNPRIATDEFGQGLATSERTGSNELVAMETGSNDAPGAITRVDSVANSGPPYAVPAPAGYHDGLIAWQQDPGTAGPAEIRVRFFDGSSLGPELIASSPAQGPAAAGRGLAAAGDISADLAIAWVQATGAGAQIVAAQLYQRPGSVAVSSAVRYARTTNPTFAWSAPREQWPPIRYVVTVDGSVLPETSATRIAVPLAQGPHTWSVAASNRGGLTSTSRTGRIWVDTVAPAVQIKITGKTRAGSAIHLALSYTDAPPPEPPADASGIAKVTVKWGDGRAAAVGHRKYHVYMHAGRYTISAIVADRAGNVTTVKQTIRIRPKPGPKAKRRHKHK